MVTLLLSQLSVDALHVFTADHHKGEQHVTDNGTDPQVDEVTVKCEQCAKLWSKPFYWSENTKTKKALVLRTARPFAHYRSHYFLPFIKIPLRGPPTTIA